MGLKDLAILDDGMKFERIAVDEKIERRKKRLQRKLSKKDGAKKGQKKSNNYIKLQRKISKLDANVARRREHYQYNVVSQIVVKDCEYIGIEDLNVKGMSASGRAKKKLTAEEYAKLSKCDKKKYNRKKSKGFNKSVLNAGFYSFKTKLEHKASQKGKEVVTIGRFYASSQNCSVCGAKNKKTKNLIVREWTCPECGTHHDRDVNAAKNIRNEAIRIKNDKGEPTPKNLPRCNRKVKSVENHRNEKSVSDGVVSRLVEPEIQVIHSSRTTESDVITESQVVILQE
jgi:putative transposase